MVLSQLSMLIIGGDVSPKSVVRLMRDGEELAIITGTADEVAAEARKIASRPSSGDSDGQAGDATAPSALGTPPAAPGPV
jgi:hypothetical protein